MAEIYQLPDSSSNSGNASIPFSIPIGGFGNGFGGFGNGMNGVFDIFALALVASMFGGWNNGGFGFGGYGNNNAAAGYIANQLNNDSGRELLMNAITSQGESQRAAVQNLATMIGQDFNLVNSGINGIQSALNTMAVQQAVSVPQIINSIQSGNQSLTQLFSQCCCQTQQQIMAQGYENQIRTLEQTNNLSTQAERNTNGVLAAINAQTVAMNDQFCAQKERELQSKIDTQSDIITQLRGQIDNAQQTNQIIGYVNTVIAPLQSKVDQIASKQLPTVNVQWPQLAAVNTSPYVSGGYYGNGWNGSIVF